MSDWEDDYEVIAMEDEGSHTLMLKTEFLISFFVLINVKFKNHSLISEKYRNKAYFRPKAIELW